MEQLAEATAVRGSQIFARHEVSAGDIDGMTSLKSFAIIVRSEIDSVVIRQGLRIGDLRSPQGTAPKL